MKRQTTDSYTCINVVDEIIAVLLSALMRTPTMRTCIVVARWLAHAHIDQNKNECV